MRWIAPFLFLVSITPAAAQQRSLHLPVGDPARREREAKVLLDAVTDTSTGELLTPGEAVSRLAGAGIVIVGESHTSMDFHRVQQRVIRGLLNAGRKVLIGLEMYPYTEQRHLDDWCRGHLTESGFVELSHWYRNWGYHWDYYRDIFLYARDHGIRMFAVNAPRETVAAVRKKGFQNLTPEESSHIPVKIDTSNEDHFTLFKAFFDEATGMHANMSDQQARAMFEAQCTWDATMAFNAVRALEANGDENTVMVVLIGSGHAAYGLGIERQAAQWYAGKIASLIPIQVIDDKDRPVESVRASYANFLWGLPQERDPLYPESGLAMTDTPEHNGRRVLSVSEGSAAETAGFRVGDIVLSMDGNPLTDRETFNRSMAEKSWGDAAEFAVRRGDETITQRIFFRRKAK